MVGAQFAVWDLRPEDAIWARLRRPGCGDRFDVMDGVFCDDCLSWCGLERGEYRKSDKTDYAACRERLPILSPD